MTIPVARMNDLSSGDPCGAPPRPCIEGSGSVFVNNLPVHCVGMAWAPHACPLSPPHPAATAAGSGTVFVEGVPIARLNDPIDCGSIIAMASGDVFAG